MNIQEGDFVKKKSRALDKKDESRKGSVDSLIVELVDFINAKPDYFTTSSCSGRIVVLTTNDSENNTEHTSAKKGCKWHLVSHVAVKASDVLNCLKSATESTRLKFEGFIMHINCRDLKSAILMQNAALSSGFRNSGITIGKHGRNLQVAIRGTMNLEVPLMDTDGKRITSDEYIQHVVTMANDKLTENEKKITRFNKSLHYLLQLQCQDTPKIKPKTTKTFSSDTYKVKPAQNDDMEHLIEDINTMFHDVQG
ncbi:tRNA wybutosine-synthesizing protein 3 homolog [Ciona intestinalis]